jgi:hypothetical protein
MISTIPSLHKQFTPNNSFITGSGSISGGDDSKPLRFTKMQDELFNLGKDSRYFLIVAPSGSGKTVGLIRLAINDLRESNLKRKVLIVAPMREICKGFESKKGKPYRFRLSKDGDEVVDWSLLENNFFDENSKTDKLKEFLLSDSVNLSSSKDSISSVGVATQQAFACVWKDLTHAEKLRAINKLTFIVDECHHIRHALSDEDLDGYSDLEVDTLKSTATAIGSAVSFIMSNENSDAKIILATATFVRGDRSTMLSESFMEKFEVYVYAWDRHMKEIGIRDFWMEYCAYEEETPLDVVYANIKLEPNEHHLVIVPSMNRKWRRTFGLKEWFASFERLFPGQVLDLVATGTQEANKEKLRANPKEYKIVVACCIFNEGADWVPCSRVHITAIEGSITLALQRIGRSTRREDGKEVIKAIYYHAPFKPDDDEEDKAKRLIKLERSYNEHSLAICMSMVCDSSFDPIKVPRLPDAKGVGCGWGNREIIPLNQVFKDYSSVISDINNAYTTAPKGDTAENIIGRVIDEHSDEWEEEVGRDELINRLKQAYARRFDKTYNHNEFNLGKIDLFWEKIKQAEEHLFLGVIRQKDFDDLKVILGKRGESAAREKFTAIRLKYGTKDKVPPYKDEDKDRRADGHWISLIKQAKAGKGKGKWYPVLDEDAKNNGWEGFFDDLRGIGEEAVRKRFAGIMLKYGTKDKVPSCKDKDKDRRADNQWISNMKRAKTGRSKWYPILDEDAKNNGWEGVFDALKSVGEEAAREKFTAIRLKYGTKDEVPSYRDKDKDRRIDYQWICRMKQAKAGRNKSKWYPILDEDAKNNGWEGVFD